MGFSLQAMFDELSAILAEGDTERFKAEFVWWREYAAKCGEIERLARDASAGQS